MIYKFDFFFLKTITFYFYTETENKLWLLNTETDRK